MAAGARVQLRGYERLVTSADHANSKIVHAMALRAGPEALEAFLDHLPQAAVLTFNRHPRMRAKQVRGEFALAEIQPPITLESLSRDKLLTVRELTENADESWEQFAEHQCELPLDRYTQLPFYIHAWRDASRGLVRLMVFSDHYMADGVSGLAVLDDLASFASKLSQESSVEAENSRVESRDAALELPLRESLYELWLAPNKWRLRLSRLALSLFGKMIFKHELKNFTPVIAPRTDQADFSVPMNVNSTSALFDQGSPENMRSALRRCKDEGVTYFGALAAAVVVAYYVASSRDTDEASWTKPFTLGVEVDFNMRKRIPAPVEEVHVGSFLATSAIESIAKVGVDFHGTTFWDFARRCKRELSEAFDSVFMPLTLLFVDKYINSQIAPKFTRQLPVPHSATTDINISNIGKYPYSLEHTITGSSGSSESLKIESVHVYNSTPNVGSIGIVYVTATDRFNYALSHKYESDDARRLFAVCVACLERLGEIGSHESMADVAKAVAIDAKGAGMGAASSSATVA